MDCKKRLIAAVGQLAVILITLAVISFTLLLASLKDDSWLSFLFFGLTVGFGAIGYGRVLELARLNRKLAWPESEEFDRLTGGNL